MSTPDDAAERNAVLRSLPASERAALLSVLELRHVRMGTTFIDPGEPIEEIWFPVSAVGSMITEASEGDSVEVATIGRDGLVGAEIFLAITQVPQKVQCQIEGEVLVGPAAKVVARNGDSHLAVAARRYVHTVMTQASQGVLCNKIHPLEQRAARWLLSVHDRLDVDRFRLTHEYFATMLGSHRPSVTIAAGMLQKAGLIRYARGDLEILDREGLQAAACECYRAVTDHYTTTMGGGGMTA